MVASIAQNNIGINNPTPDASAALDIWANDKGLLIPRMTTAQREAIPTPSNGLLVFDKSWGSFWYYKNGSEGWIEIGQSVNQSEIFDQDHDTYITTEETSDENIIHLYIAGTEKAAFRGNNFEQPNNGSSVFIGRMAGENDDLSNNKNVFIGYLSGMDNGTGEKNAAIGENSLNNNTTGSFNTALGSGSLFANTTGENNVGIGGALGSNTTGNNNVSVGKDAHPGFGGDISDIVAIGYYALHSNGTGASNPNDGQWNTAVGTQALSVNSTGYANTAVGFTSLNSNNGNNNTATGYRSLLGNSAGNNNCAFGSESLYGSSNNNNNCAFGYNTLHFNSADNNTAIGNQVMTNNAGASNTGVGSYALKTNGSGYGNVATGFFSLTNNNVGFNNTAAGNYSLYDNSNGYDNTAFGYGSLYANQSGYKNTAIGKDAFSSAINFHNSTAIGYDAQPSGSNTVQIGNSAISSIGGYANWTNVSDGRFKTNVKENVQGLDFIMKLRPVTYNLDMDAIAGFNKTPDTLRLNESERLKGAEAQIGFIAQEVEEAAKELNFDFHGVDKPKNENSHYGLRYAEFVVPLVQAMQEQQEIIEELKKRIEQLEKK